MQTIFGFVAVAQLDAKTRQNRLLATVNGGLIGTQPIGHFGFCAFIPKQLFDQPPLLRERGTDSTAQVVIRMMRPSLPSPQIY